jgi:hypothetical protein
LNLQNASVVINCDLPWNPAKLEQRIARAWRKHQTRPVTVINLVSENTIESRMLETLAQKQALADGVLDHLGNLTAIKLRTGRQAFLAKLEQLVTPLPGAPAPAQQLKPPLPADRPMGLPKPLIKLSTAHYSAAKNAIQATARTPFCSSLWKRTPFNGARNSVRCTRITFQKNKPIL